MRKILFPMRFFASLKPGQARIASIGALVAGLTPVCSHAGLPLPDHVVFGTIAISNQPVTSFNTDVVIEARRTSNGPVVAAYTMGSASRLGTYYYELRFQLEDSAPSSDAVVLPGEQLLLTVRNAAGVKFSTNHQVPDQGIVERLDFGPSVDADGNGAPDGWELAYLGVNNANLNLDSDGDGATDGAEYVAGTNPTNSNDAFQLEVAYNGNEVQVSFYALAAAGIGYEGLQRFYALESSTNLDSGPWIALSNFSRVPGNNQVATYTKPVGGTNVTSFFRARIWLERPR